VPAVVGLHNASSQVQAGQLVIIDGSANTLILDPTEEELARAADHGEDHRPAATVDAERRRPAATADGVRIRLEANIEFPDDLAAARYAGAEGIGLYRSEFLVTSGANDIGDEDRQYEIYRGMLEGMAPGSVTVRTFDVDEDQLASRQTRRPFAGGWEPEAQRTSRQGLRGLRLSLTRPALFLVQLRALLRAARHGHLRIMFPFVSSVEQVRAARAMIAQASADLAARGMTAPPVPVGVMIEIPAAAYTADLLAREVDFFTIGTNDLIQYCLAVDRADERVSKLYEPLHPAILRIILMVRRAAGRRRIPVSLCGEMASDAAVLTLLVGLGLTEFSMTPGAIPVAKQVLSELRYDELRAVARPHSPPRNHRRHRARAAGHPWPAGAHQGVNRGRRDDARGKTVGLRAALGEDRSLRRQADSRQRRTRAEPAVPQPEGRDHLPALGQAVVRDRTRRQTAETGNAARRVRAHHAEDRTPDDGDRRQRHLRGLDTGTARRRPTGRQVRKD
jgi:phosphotransferase system enzyme I (PtsI)